jgi:2-oxoglutarate dehydrogenase E1 component
MTPKSLLRHPQAMSALRELAEGNWQPVIDDEDADPEQVTRLIFCSGKVYVDLVANEGRQKAVAVAIVRVEQLYPFPLEELQSVLNRYPNLTEVVWLQEEAQNMGAWEYARPLLQEMLDGKLPLRYIGRPRRASPAEGSAAWHQSNQAAIIAQGLTLEQAPVITTTSTTPPID